MKNNIGALWLKTSKTGKNFFSGVIEVDEGIKTKIVIFKNEHKDDDKHPDYKIYISEERKQNNQKVVDDESCPF